MPYYVKCIIPLWWLMCISYHRHVHLIASTHHQ